MGVYGRTLVLFMLALEFLLVPLSSHPVSVAAAGISHPVSVAAPGSLYITPVAMTALPVGSSFSILVKVAGMDQFNGWEIQIVSDPNVINPTSISTAGNIFQANTTGGFAFEIRNSVNGAGPGSCLTNACSPVDGPGIADSAYLDTKLASGNGLLFNVTFKVVSSKPYSPITIQNDVLSNGGANGVVHSTSNAQYGSPSSIAVSSFFTSLDCLIIREFNGTHDSCSLPLDKFGNPSVNVLFLPFLKGLVIGTDPHVVLAWVNITNNGQTSLQSLALNETLPVDWLAFGPISFFHWLIPAGVHVYYANTTSFVTNPEITDPSTITVTTTNPQTVNIAIPSLSSTAIGHPLLPGQSILVSVMMIYGLTFTHQSMTGYPRNYTDTFMSTAWSQPSFSGGNASSSGSGFFTAHARLLGDFRGDGKVDIRDVGLVLGAFGSSPGSPNWNPAADFDNDGSVGLNDVQVILSNFGAQ